MDTNERDIYKDSCHKKNRIVNKKKRNVTKGNHGNGYTNRESLEKVHEGFNFHFKKNLVVK